MEFLDPIPGIFTYVGWNIDLKTVGPVVRKSSIREEAVRLLSDFARSLEQVEGVDRVRLLETVAIIPIPGAPRFDVILLVNGVQDVGTEVETAVQAGLVPQSAKVICARNVARFGDTDAREGVVLLNHFLGHTSSTRAVQTWKAISSWYESVLHVDNSTLLEVFGKQAFLAVNYATIPGTIRSFMLGQILRPGFYRNVIGRLAPAGLRPCPLFLRRVNISGS